MELSDIEIKQNLEAIKSELPQGVTLVAVSKTKPIEMLQAAYDAGIRIFGENKVQELVEKHEALPKDIEWHMIGHLQSNKVKYIAPFISLIHGVDSLSLLETINKEGKKNNRVIPCLLQMHIAQEDTKFGMNVNDVLNVVGSEAYKSLQNIEIRGVMGMATFTDNTEIVHQEFKQLKNIFNQLKSQYFANQPSFNTLSMGMSDDYKIAIQEGSTMVRIGSSIFGHRYYANK
ncbi:MAG: YggS family pyridoxal phosphate-dependent enzyme [Marinifilaceae bacterium]